MKKPEETFFFFFLQISTSSFYLLFHDLGDGVTISAVYPNGIVNVCSKLDGGAIQVKHQLTKLGQREGNLQTVVETTDDPLQAPLTVRFIEYVSFKLHRKLAKNE